MAGLGLAADLVGASVGKDEIHPSKHASI